jgi:hypothetical protein
LHIIYAHNSHSSQQKPTGLHVWIYSFIFPNRDQWLFL